MLSLRSKNYIFKPGCTEASTNNLAAGDTSAQKAYMIITFPDTSLQSMTGMFYTCRQLFTANTLLEHTGLLLQQPKITGP
jgi:hypothetical protein